MDSDAVSDQSAVGARIASVVNWYAGEGGPSYRRVPSELVAHDFFDGIELNVQALLAFIESGRMPTAHELRPVTDLAMARLANGASLQEVIGSYQVVSADLWRRFISESDPSEREGLLDLMPKVTDYIFNVVTLIATEAAHRSADPSAEARERDRAAADALLATGEASGPFDVDPSCFVIAVFRLAGSPGAGSSVATLKSRIESMPNVRLRLDLNGWVVVHWSAQGREAATLDLTNALELSRDAAGVRCWAGIASSSTALGVPDAYRVARGLSGAAAKLDRPEFVVDLVHSTIEYLACASGPDLPAVADLVEPLGTADPIFEQTLQIFLDENCNQLATARRMHVHRNSVTYRLAKVHALTGLNPLIFTQAASLHAALIARDLS